MPSISRLRGAGNLLGSQQSGHITAVGFDLYCQLLAQSIGELKGEKPKTRVNVHVRLDFLAMTPGDEIVPDATGTVFDPLAETQTGHQRPPRIRRRRRHPMDRRRRRSAQEIVRTRRQEGARRRARRRRQGARLSAARLYPRAIAARGSLSTPGADRRPRRTRRVATRAAGPIRPLPDAVDLLLQLGELRMEAAAGGVNSIEVIGGKLKLTRNNQLMTVGGHFPRLSKRDPRARLAELRKMISTLT